MATLPRPTRSLKHEYELFVEQEIENYKESVPRNVLLGIGDDAVSSLSAAPQLTLTEMVLWEEVDRIIFKRLRLPSYDAWRRRRLKIIEELRRPEYWGLAPDDVLVRAFPPSTKRVLVAGARDEVPSLYFAANGCDVTTLASEADAIDRVMQAAIGVGLAGRVHAHVGDLSSWTPQVPLHAVIVNPVAFVGMSADQQVRAIEALQGATMDGGIHLLQTAGVAETADVMSIDELRARYRGWTVTVERAEGLPQTFLARKGAA